VSGALPQRDRSFLDYVARTQSGHHAGAYWIKEVMRLLVETPHGGQHTAVSVEVQNVFRVTVQRAAADANWAGGGAAAPAAAVPLPGPAFDAVLQPHALALPDVTGRLLEDIVSAHARQQAQNLRRHVRSAPHRWATLIADQLTAAFRAVGARRLLAVEHRERLARAIVRALLGDSDADWNDAAWQRGGAIWGEAGDRDGLDDAQRSVVTGLLRRWLGRRRPALEQLLPPSYYGAVAGGGGVQQRHSDRHGSLYHSSTGRPQSLRDWIVGSFRPIDEAGSDDEDEDAAMGGPGGDGEAHKGGNYAVLCCVVLCCVVLCLGLPRLAPACPSLPRLASACIGLPLLAQLAGCSTTSPRPHSQPQKSPLSAHD
jgi:hypothetical protein